VSEVVDPQYCSCNKEETFTLHVRQECNMKCYSAPALQINDYDSSNFTLPVQFISPVQTAEYCTVCKSLALTIAVFPKYRLLEYQTL
jgi:hypothetical protein